MGSAFVVPDGIQTDFVKSFDEDCSHSSSSDTYDESFIRKIITEIDGNDAEISSVAGKALLDENCTKIVRYVLPNAIYTTARM